MRKPIKKILATTSVLAIVLGIFSGLPLKARADEEPSAVDQGKSIAFNRKKGNCLACHKMKGGKLEGNIGPELINVKARYPDKATLRAQIWDATVNNPNTMMPPFGKHKILSEKELDKVVEFIQSL